MKLIDTVTKDKLRGGFYTPKEIANFMIKWGVSNSEKQNILEPSCGDGIFLSQLKNLNLSFKKLTAIEYNTDEFLKAKSINVKNSTVLNEDFLKFFHTTNDKFDLVIGNPPYIRYQYFDNNQKKDAESIFKKAGLKYSKLTNAWVSFVIGSSLLLKDTGKIAFVLPAEILQVSYAQQLRVFLGHYYNKINIISFQKLVFPNIQQEVVLLLCEKDKSDSHMIEHLELTDSKDLENLDLSTLEHPRKKIDFNSNKWTFYFLEQNEIDFLENLIDNNILPKLSEYAKVEVGITTGSNPFFTVDKEMVNHYSLETFAKPLVGRSVQVPSIIFNLNDWNNNKINNARTHLLTFKTINEMKNDLGALNYIKKGEKEGINKGYKCRIRDEWQIIPSLRVSDALFIRRNNLYPKLIINDAKAYTTDTMHRVTIKENVNKHALISSYYNSISLAFTEICGRSHGGGVLELMPNEAENILIPYDESNDYLIHEIDKMMRNGTNIVDILNVTDTIILKEKYKFSSKEIQLARNIWLKLSKRRLNRGRK